MLLRRMQGFRLNIHAAPGCSPSTWHLEAQAEELRDVVACYACSRPTHISGTYPTSTIGSCHCHDLHHIQVQNKYSNRFALAVEQIQQVRMPVS